MVAVGGLVLTLFPPTAPIGAATLISSSIVGAPGAAYGTGNSLSDQRNILTINPKYDDRLYLLKVIQFRNVWCLQFLVSSILPKT